MRCIVQDKEWPEHKWDAGKYDGRLTQYCSRCGAKKATIPEQK